MITKLSDRIQGNEKNIKFTGAKIIHTYDKIKTITLRNMRI
jgi:hypothetical protein